MDEYVGAGGDEVVDQAGGDDALIATAYHGAEHLARTLHARSGSVEDLVAAICDQAVGVVGPAVAAGVIIASSSHRLTTVAATGAAPAELDRLQARTGVGPCLTAASEQVVIRVDDTSHEDRWPDYAAAAQRLGVASVLCLPLAAEGRLQGTLSLYAEDPAAFDGRGDEPAWQMLVALASVALAQARLTEQLREALLSRDVIGQAKGIVMTRYGLKPDKAFDLIRQYSQDHNIKIIELAQAVIDLGDFPT